MVRDWEAIGRLWHQKSPVCWFNGSGQNWNYLESRRMNWDDDFSWYGHLWLLRVFPRWPTDARFCCQHFWLQSQSEAASNQAHNFKSWAISLKKVKIYTEFDDAVSQWRSVELQRHENWVWGWSAIPAHMGLVLSIKVLAAICLSWPAFVPAPRGNETNDHELRWTIRSPSWQHFRANWWQMIANGWMNWFIDWMNEWILTSRWLVVGVELSFYCHCQLCSHLGDDLPQPIHLGWGENANELGSVTEFQKRFSWQEQTLPTVCKSRHRQLGHGVAPQIQPLAMKDRTPWAPWFLDVSWGCDRRCWGTGRANLSCLCC